MIVAGIGMKKGAPPEDIRLAIDKALQQSQTTRSELDALATLDEKSTEAGLRAVADELRLPVIPLSHECLASASDRTLTKSKLAIVTKALPSVAETAALAALGNDAKLLGPRSASTTATCALATGSPDETLDEDARAPPMTVHFIGAGPGAPDLITLRGKNLIARCPVCLYAGSLVPTALLEHCPPKARIIDTAPMSLEELATEFQRAFDNGHDIARLHSGDISIWSAIGEQIRVLNEREIPYTLTPGVPSFAAAASALGRELTLPEVAQSLVLTRTSGRASKMPPTETLEAFAETRATLAIHLSIHTLDKVVVRLTPFYSESCPVAIVVKASWPDQRIIRATLATICDEVANADPIERTAIIFIGEALSPDDFKNSALYDANYQRRYRGRPA